MRNRGVNDILIACVDGWAGFSETIEAAFPKTEVQHFIIHQIRNSTKFVSYRDIKTRMSDLTKVIPLQQKNQLELNQRDLEVFEIKNIQRFISHGRIIGQLYQSISNIRNRSAV